MKSLTYVEIDVPDFAGSSPEVEQTFRFALDTNYLPASIDAIPSIQSVTFSPARISLGKDLGERASLRIAFHDHKHILGSESYSSGTFWGKWRARYGTKLRGRNLRLIRGQTGQTIDQMDVRYYVIDKTDGPTLDGVYTIEAKDILKLADNDRAQAPVLSNGSLAGSINDSTTAATLSPTGIGDAEYPASGWVCIGGKEVCSFTRSGNALTITRAQFGTVAQAHNSGDRVQLVLRYTGDDVADIIRDLMVNYAGVPASYIDLAEWQAETAAYLGVIYAATITEPTSVRDLISALIEQAALAVWWDDRARMVRLNVLREIATDSDTFDQDRILEGSLKIKEQADKRISQIWTYYGQRDPTDSGAGKDNYRAVLADVDLEKQGDYGSAEIRKIEARWIETETAATRLNSIQLSRFRDPPRFFAFDLFRTDSIIPVAGYQLKWWGNQDTDGNEVPALIQVTQVTLHPDRIHVEAEEMLASGSIVLVNVVFLTETGSLLEWEVPDTWNDDDNTVELIAGGGGGASVGSTAGKGGGAGAYSKVTNLVILGSPPIVSSPPQTIQYRVGDGGAGGVGSGIGSNGEDTWFDGTSLGSCSVGAEGGDGGTGRTTGGQGGQASNGTGDTKFSGGSGGNGAPPGEIRAGGGGGGGAAGPNGNGGNGGNQTSISQDGGAGGGGANGGDNGNVSVSQTGGDGGDNRFGFGGGDSSTPNGQESGGGRGGDNNQDGSSGGAGEQLWTQTVSPIVSAGPGGGGGGGGDDGSGANGGLYGGGGGGGGDGGARAGNGRQGIIVITWREAE